MAIPKQNTIGETYGSSPTHEIKRIAKSNISKKVTDALETTTDAGLETLKAAVINFGAIAHPIMQGLTELIESGADCSQYYDGEKGVLFRDTSNILLYASEQALSTLIANAEQLYLDEYEKEFYCDKGQSFRAFILSAEDGKRLKKFTHYINPSTLIGISQRSCSQDFNMNQLREGLKSMTCDYIQFVNNQDYKPVLKRKRKKKLPDDTVIVQENKKQKALHSMPQIQEGTNAGAGAETGTQQWPIVVSDSTSSEGEAEPNTISNNKPETCSDDIIVIN